MLLGALFFFIMAYFAYRAIMSLPDRPIRRKADLVPYLAPVVIPAFIGAVFLIMALSPGQ